jgi:inner membrane transporter RhtA
VLMSLEPAIAALIGFVVLKETIGLRGLVALALIIVSSSGVSFFQKHGLET